MSDNLSRSLIKVQCKIHPEIKPLIEESTKKLYCKKCNNIDKNNNSSNNLIVNNDINTAITTTTSSTTNNNEQNNIKNNNTVNYTNDEICDYHQNDKANFYCEDCLKSLCNECFQNHKSHKCFTPNISMSNFKQELEETKDKLKEIKLNTEDNINNLKPVQDFYKSLKDNLNSAIKSNIEKVQKFLNKKSAFFDVACNRMFNGLDNEIEETLSILNQFSKQLKNSSNKLSEMNEVIEDNSKSDVEICIFKKENNKKLSEIEHLVTDVEAYLSNKFKNLKIKIDNNMKKFEDESINLNNKIQKYEANLLDFIKSGIPSNCYRLRRFRSFFTYDVSKYYRNSSICLMVSKSISLCGLGLCGLYIENKNLYNSSSNDSKNTLKVKIKIIESLNISSSTNADKNNDNKNNETNDVKNVVMSMDVNIPSIRNAIDPVYQFYFNKAVNLYNDKVYYITIDSLNDDSYIKIWTGSFEDKDTFIRERGLLKTDNNNNNINNVLTEENNEKDQIHNQTIICNDTYVKFNLLKAFDYESDLNEFTMGIISDLIFAYSG